MRVINSKAINTLRIITINQNGSPYVLSSLLRVGTSKSGNVDNWAAGGLAVGINKTGYLKDWGYYKPIHGLKACIHPDTQVVFSQFKVPMYQEALDLIDAGEGEGLSEDTDFVDCPTSNESQPVSEATDTICTTESPVIIQTEDISQYGILADSSIEEICLAIINNQLEPSHYSVYMALINAVISSSVTPPGRRSLGGSSAKEITVDSTPISQFPPSIISGILPFISS